VRKGGIMSQNSKKSALGSLVALLLGLVVAKGIWSIIEFRYLPKKGMDVKEEYGLKPLYYHYNLASKKEIIKPIVHKKAPKKVVMPKVVQKKILPEKIESFHFKGLYNSPEKKLIVIEYKGNSFVLGVGEELEGYKLLSLHGTKALFIKGGKRYTLDIYQDEKKSKAMNLPSQGTPSISTRAPAQHMQQRETPRSQAAALTIRKEGETTIIPKDLFDRYRTDLRHLQRSINAVPYMVNGQIEGFRVNYIKKGSDFAKLGIQKGDILLSINGEPLNDLSVPIKFFKNLNTMTAATFTIKRGNEIKELEYEVR